MDEEKKVPEVKAEVKPEKKVANKPDAVKPDTVKTVPIKISLREFCNALGNKGTNQFAYQTILPYCSTGELKTRDEWEAFYLNLMK